MEKWDFGLDISRLISTEYSLHRDTFEEFRKSLYAYFVGNRLYFFEDDLLEKFQENEQVQGFLDQGKVGMQAIDAAFPDRYVLFGNRYKMTNPDKNIPVYFDMWVEHYLSPEDLDFNLFYTYQLRQTDLLELDSLLNYTLENYYYGDRTSFLRFLALTLRKHAAKLLDADQLETINEWMALKEKEPILPVDDEIRTKGKIKRRRDDNITQLNQEQTALFIYCLQKTNVILSDENLNNKEAGQAFSILTGYSADTIRQNLSKSELRNISTLKNVDTLIKTLTGMKKFVEDTIKGE